MSDTKKVYLSLLSVFVLLFVYVSFRFVWPPDVITQTDRLITTRSLPDGTVIELRQFWNGGDFYTTYVRHQFAPDESYHEVVDPDSDKIWRARIEMKQDENGVDIFIRKNATPTYEYMWDVVPQEFEDGGSILLNPNDPPKRLHGQFSTV